MDMLPCHGKIECRVCFTDNENITTPHPEWRLRNDPGAWGSATPRVLVLGFSKGSTQVDIYDSGRFEDVAFGGLARNRLDQILKKVGVITADQHISTLIASSDQEQVAVGSLVRCSLSRKDRKTGNWKSSGQLILKSFNEVPDVLAKCTKKYLSNLPCATKFVVLLGTTDSYINKCFRLLAKIYPDLERVNAVSYRSGPLNFVHLTHPSPGNGHFNAWLADSLKMKMAKEFISPDTL